MKKRKNLGKKLVTMLVSVGFFAVLITVLNLMALQAIRGKNNVLIEQFEQYEEAVENNDTAVFETAKGEVAEAIRHSNYRINGSIIFDLALDVIKKSSACRLYLQAKYFKVYIDEYQDCDQSMHALFMYICDNLGIDTFVVGDEKQSIYT